MPAKVILRVTSGPLEGTEFCFVEHDTFLFGRHESCHARLPDDPRVSRHHFLLEANPPVVLLRDLGSRNGTYVNGVKYGGRKGDGSSHLPADHASTETELHDGDQIKVGRTIIHVRVVLPVTCCQCGEEACDGEAREAVPESYLCAACQAYPETEEFRARRSGESKTCVHCGKSLDGDDADHLHGPVLCSDCQSELMSDGLQGLIEDAVPALFSELEPRVPGYDLLHELGRGGMGVVYMASRKSDDLPVAIKVSSPRIKVGRSAEQRFQREIAVARALRHHHIARLIDCGVTDGIHFFVMEYCNGGSLDQLLSRRGGKLPLKTAAPLMLQCLEGLEYAHGQGVVHRDLKPQNILLHQYEDKWIAKITDFSLAKSLENAGLSSLTTTGSGGGTVPYMPREQLTDFKHVTPSSDIWSLAATFYTLLTGCVPRDTHAHTDPMLVILNEEAIPIRKRDRNLPSAVAEVIDKALQTEVRDRYSNVSEMRIALRSAFTRRSRKK